MTYFIIVSFRWGQRPSVMDFNTVYVALYTFSACRGVIRKKAVETLRTFVIVWCDIYTFVNCTKLSIHVIRKIETEQKKKWFAQEMSHFTTHYLNYTFHFSHLKYFEILWLNLFIILCHLEVGNQNENTKIELLSYWTIEHTKSQNYRIRIFRYQFSFIMVI